MGGNALHQGQPHPAGDSREGGGFPTDRRPVVERGKVGGTQGGRNPDPRTADSQPAPAGGGDKQGDCLEGGRTALCQCRRSGYHQQAVRRHQEAGDGRGRFGNHQRGDEIHQLAAAV